MCADGRRGRRPADEDIPNEPDEAEVEDEEVHACARSCTGMCALVFTECAADVDEP